MNQYTVKTPAGDRVFSELEATPIETQCPNCFQVGWGNILRCEGVAQSANSRARDRDLTVNGIPFLKPRIVIWSLCVNCNHEYLMYGNLYLKEAEFINVLYDSSKTEKDVMYERASIMTSILIKAKQQIKVATEYVGRIRETTVGIR